MASLQREAQAWVVRLDSRQVTEDDARAFKRWCAQSRAHAEAFARARAVWQAMAPAAQRVRNAEPAPARARRIAPPARRAFLGGAVAASVVLLGVRPPLGLWPAVGEWNADYRTGTGEQREVAMADGVVLQLNTQTRVNLQREGSAAGFELLAGEAEVLAESPAAGRVTVHAGGGTVTAERARFNLRHTDAEVCVSCLAGRVEVRSGSRREVLAAGRQLRYGPAGLGAAEEVDTAAVSAWRRRLLVFKQVPLSEVVAEVNRYRSGRLILTREALGRQKVQASFSIDRLDDVAALVRDVYGAELTRLPGGIVLLG